MFQVLPESPSRASPSGLSGSASAAFSARPGETDESMAAGSAGEDASRQDFSAALNASQLAPGPAVNADASSSLVDAANVPPVAGRGLPQGGRVLPGLPGSGDPAAKDALLAPVSGQSTATTGLFATGKHQQTDKGLTPSGAGAGGGSAALSLPREARMLTATRAATSLPVRDATLAGPDGPGVPAMAEPGPLPAPASPKAAAEMSPGALDATSLAARGGQAPDLSRSLGGQSQAIQAMRLARDEGGRVPIPGDHERLLTTGGSPVEPPASAGDASAHGSVISKPSAVPSAPPAAAPPAASPGDARGDSRTAGQVEAALDQLAGSREGQRNLRPEVNLRHGEFGQVNLRLDSSGESLRATLTAHDPGFVPAVRQALAERGGFERSLAPEQAVQSGVPLTQRVLEASGGSGAGSAGGGSQGSAGGGSGQNPGQGSAHSGPHSEARYGSSPGSDQGTPQPYSAKSRDEGREGSPSESDRAETGETPGGGRSGRERGLYA